MDIEIDPGFVECYLDEFAKYGEYGETGVWRTLYSPEWVAAADRYADWCREAGFEVRRDAVGNIWGRLKGRDHGNSIVSGSHVDTVTPGGKFDGALGAIGALIAIRALLQRYGQPRRTLTLRGSGRADAGSGGAPWARN